MSKILINKIENGVQVIDVDKDKIYNYTVYPFHCDGRARFMSVAAYGADVLQLTFQKSRMEYDTTDDISCNKYKYIQNLIRIIKSVYAIWNINCRNNTTLETYSLLLELLYKKDYISKTSTEDFCREISCINRDFSLTKPMVSKIIASLTENDHLYDAFRAYVMEFNSTRYKLNPFFEMTIDKKTFYSYDTKFIEAFITYQNLIEHIIKNEIKFTEQVINTSKTLEEMIPQEYQEYLKVTCVGIMEQWYDLNKVAGNNWYIASDLLQKILDIIKIAKELNIEYSLKKLKSATHDKLLKELKKLERQKRILECTKEQAYFVSNQHNIPNFENENFKLFIPKDYMDCVTVGEHFHNCFAEYEWRNYLKNGYRYGMTIIDKATNKHIICLDVNIRSKEIIQWLGPCNQSLGTLFDDLKKELQIFLKANLP